MDEFQRKEVKDKILDQQITPMWTEFLESVKTLVGSYNGTTQGIRHPAKIKTHQHQAVVTCILGLAADQFNVSAVAVHLRLEQDNSRILATTERWTLPPGTTPDRIAHNGTKQSTNQIIFSLDCDPETGDVWLTTSQGAARLPTFKHAEKLLLEALS